mgnify:FL=1
MIKVNEYNIIETIDEDGEVIKFELFDVIEFEEKEYALLLPVGVEVDEDSDESEMVLMRLVKDGEDYSFETIDDEEEFERVSDYLESIEDED